MSKPARQQLDIHNVSGRLGGYAARLRPYRVVIFLLFVGLLYAIVLLRIQSLTNVQPTSDAVSAQVQAASIPHIDQSVVRQLQSLQDNSVNVQALFNQARSNPFQ